MSQQVAVQAPSEQPTRKSCCTDDYKSYFFGWLTAIIFSWGNYIIALVSDLSYKQIYGQWLGALVTWVFFHGYYYTQHRRSGAVGPYFSKETSVYYTKTEAGPRLSFKKLMTPILVALSNCGIIGTTSITFNFATKANVNPGVIATIFCSSAIFTTIFFYLLYNQRLSVYDSAGIGCILGSVVVIGLSRDTGDAADEAEETDPKYLVYSVLFAVLVGLLMSLRALFVEKGRIDNNSSPIEIVCNSNLVFTALMLPLFIYDQRQNQTFDLRDFSLANPVMLTTGLGIVTLSIGMKLGKGGPVQAIEQTKSVYQTLWGALLLGNYPNSVQVMGMVLGILGLIVLVTQPSKQPASIKPEAELKSLTSPGDEEEKS